MSLFLLPPLHSPKAGWYDTTTSSRTSTSIRTGKLGSRPGLIRCVVVEGDRKVSLGSLASRYPFDSGSRLSFSSGPSYFKQHLSARACMSCTHTLGLIFSFSTSLLRFSLSLTARQEEGPSPGSESQGRSPCSPAHTTPPSGGAPAHAAVQSQDALGQGFHHAGEPGGAKMGRRPARPFFFWMFVCCRLFSRTILNISPFHFAPSLLSPRSRS